MALRLKNISEIKRIFGLTSVGAFANNNAIKNNPQLIDLLLNKQERIRAKKASYQTLNFKKVVEENKVKDTEQKTAIVVPMPSNVKEFDKRENEFMNIYWQSTSKARYYSIHLQPTLFGEWSVTRSWGSIYNHLGKCKTMFFSSIDAAKAEIEKLQRQRKYRGYQRV